LKTNNPAVVAVGGKYSRTAMPVVLAASFCFVDEVEEGRGSFPKSAMEDGAKKCSTEY